MRSDCIHYCWFGGGPLTEVAERTILSWAEYAPRFEIRRWDEGNFDVSAYAWTRDAYAAGKYAFVSDYARLKILYEYGGVYMDVGSELIRDISDLVAESTPFVAMEEMTLTATPGLIASVGSGDDLIGAVLDAYERLEFSSDPSYLAKHTINQMFTRELESRGFVRKDCLQRVGDWTILPSVTFDPVFGFGGYHVKKETYSIHRSSSSWAEPKFQIKREFQDKWTPLIGRRFAQICGRILGEIRSDGFFGGVRNLAGVALSVVKRRMN